MSKERLETEGNGIEPDSDVVRDAEAYMASWAFLGVDTNKSKSYQYMSALIARVKELEDHGQAYRDLIAGHGKQLADSQGENAKLNTILYHHENGLSHPALQEFIDAAGLVNQEVDNANLRTACRIVQIGDLPMPEFSPELLLGGKIDTLEDAYLMGFESGKIACGEVLASPLAGKEISPCKWSFVNGECRTDCGHLLWVTYRLWKFCPYCAKPILERTDND